MTDKICIVSIAKDEGRYIEEWVLYHLSIGVDRIVIYDHESVDGMSEVIDAMSKSLPVQRLLWSPPKNSVSPQRSAYNHAVKTIENMEWALFIDIDEFIVPWGYGSLPDFVRTIPASASSVAINWRCFGSSGREAADYGSVIRTFTRCGAVRWGNNAHVKTMARIRHVKQMRIHDAIMSEGNRVDSFFAPIHFALEGRTAIPLYNGIQINHYQAKTYGEFAARMARGNANFPAGHPRNTRNSSLERFRQLDRNEDEDLRIQPFADGMDAYTVRWRQQLG